MSLVAILAKPMVCQWKKSLKALKTVCAKLISDTDLRLASTGAIRRFLAENPAEFDPRKYLQSRLWTP